MNNTRSKRILEMCDVDIDNLQRNKKRESLQTLVNLELENIENIDILNIPIEIIASEKIPNNDFNFDGLIEIHQDEPIESFDMETGNEIMMNEIQNDETTVTSEFDQDKIDEFSGIANDPEIGDNNLLTCQMEMHDSGESTSKKSERRNNKKVNQNLRMKGCRYMGYRRPANQKRTFHDTERSEKIMGPPCDSQFCAKSKKRKCNEIKQEDRRDIFNRFWRDFNWEQRKTYVSNIVIREEPKERKQKGECSRREGTLKYSLRVGNNLLPVCKKMFLATLGIGEWQVHHWVLKSNHGITTHNEHSNDNTPLRKSEANIFMRKFLENLSKLPSHYCRQQTDKLYLEQSFATIADLYNFYKSECQEKGQVALTRNVLTKMLDKLNISLYKPKKDRCDICCQFEEKNMEETVWQKHRDNVEKARKEKEFDKNQAQNGLQHVITMDLQAVKICPSLMASSLYYKTKLCVHNFTFFNLATKSCTCYWFDETSSDLQASTFVSLIVHYIETKLNDGKPVILFSDGCTYQNRNNILSNALLHLSKRLNIVIEQKFLVRGHTQMECDSVHATIERKIKNKKIFLPSDYVRLTEEARKIPEPYESILVNYDFFFDYNNHLVYTSIRPGKKTGDPNVVDLRSIKYQNGLIYYKLDFDYEYAILPQRAKKDIDWDNLEYDKLHSERVKIKKSKFEHLQQLKPVIPQDCWSFYDSLPIE